MAGIRIGRLLQPWRGLGWWWRLGLGVPALLGLVLASIVAVSWLTGERYQPPEEISAGRVDEFEVNLPRYFEQERFWIVRLESGETLALYDRDAESGCAVPWRPDFGFRERRGWFIDACHGSVYDLAGRCFSGPCLRGLDRFAVEVDNGFVIVKLRDLSQGPPLDPNAQPVTP